MFPSRPLPPVVFLSWLLTIHALLHHHYGLAGDNRDESAAVDFARHVKPIFVQHCYRCHGPTKQESGLRLDSLDGMLTGGHRGPAVVPGESVKSLLVQVIRGQVPDEPELKMPPESEPLSPQEIARITQWIDHGAPVSDADRLPGHWAYRLPRKVPLPDASFANGSDNPIDRLLSTYHTQLGLRMADEAPREVLARRVYLDLTGLPPSPAELEAFLADSSPDAYERLVDRLLASSAYGERWGRHWMDVWRYSDWSGYGNEVRESQPHIWRWRDWIIESLNKDKPYDRMILEMLAGDEVAPDDPSTLRATGFLVRNWYRFNRNTWLEDTVEHTAKAFLGLTVNCAKCHDHPYDPIAHEEYYRFRAFFEPHQVRTDVVSTLNTAQDGLPRVYDADHQAPTYVFERGDERKPDKSRSVTAALPVSFGGVLPVESVKLPPAAYYPGLRAEVRKLLRQDLIARHRQALEAWLAAQNDTEVTLAWSFTTTQPPEQNTADGHVTALVEWLSRVELTAVRAENARQALDTFEAKIAADNVTYGIGENESDEQRQSLVYAAAVAEQRQAVWEKYAELLELSQKYHSADHPGQAQGNPAELAKQKEQVRNAYIKAQQQLAAHQQSLRSCDPKSAQYKPLTNVYPATSTGRRLALASWIASPDNPLTARVAVNHLWMRHFGQPLVERVFDFGYGSPPPRMPDLLDWLAVEFIEQGWRMKPIHRLMVTSRLYRSRSWATATDRANQSVDPDNHYFWRMNPRRMEAEVVRDCLLAVSGRLDPTMGGPDLDHTAGLTTTRRSIYYRHAYEKQMLFLQLFDAASVVECYRRSESITPQQALALSNSSLSFTTARTIIDQLDPCTDLTLRQEVDHHISRLFLLVLSRYPTQEELELCGKFLLEQANRLSDQAKLTKFPSQDNKLPTGSNHVVTRAWESLAHALLNHHDFVTIH